jgi:hypothetical protein
MAQEVQFGRANSGKIRDFGVGLLLAVVTLGFYSIFWYYFLNQELKQVGDSKADANLAQSSPGMSVLAVTLGAYVLVPPFLSIWNFLGRIQRAERLCNIPADEQIRQGRTYLLLIPFGFLIVPALIYYKTVTDHQNRVLQSVAGTETAAAPAVAAS